LRQREVKQGSRRYRRRPAEKTSQIMSSVRSRENRAEVALRKALWKRGFRYRTYSATLPGRPDLVFSRARVVVFVDGDFWHGRVFRELGRSALTRLFAPEKRAYWVRKICRNVLRDDAQSAALRADGWLVLRVWESDVLREAPAVVRRVSRTLRRRLAASSRDRARRPE
jgi:DNA mismatch endonuclease (patch repair protein)